MASNRPCLLHCLCFPLQNQGMCIKLWRNGFQIIQTMRSLLRICHIKLKQYGFKQAFSCNRGIWHIKLKQYGFKQAFSYNSGIWHIKLKQYVFKQALVSSLFVFPTTKSGNVYQSLEKWFPNYTNNEKFTQNMPHQIKAIWLQTGLQLR